MKVLLALLSREGAGYALLRQYDQLFDPEGIDARIMVTRYGQTRTIRAESDAAECTVVIAGEGEELLAGPDILHLCRAIKAGGR